MTVRFQYFQIPTQDAGEAARELNRFLRSVRVLAVRHEFTPHNGSPCWFAAVEYLQSGVGGGDAEGRNDKKGKDYKELLSPEEFAIYSGLREWRKKKGAQENIPVYTILTNEQLARVVGRRPVSLSELKEIEGIGESRVEKYGTEILDYLKSFVESSNEKQQRLVSEDSRS